MSAPDLSEVEHPSYDRLPPWEIREMHSPFDVPTPTEVACPSCGNYYHTEGLGFHWYHSPGCRPSLTDRQREIITGLMMSDGTLNRREGKNPRLDVKMVTEKYLAYLDREFGCLGLGVRLKQTATEKARQARRNGFQSDAEARSYQDIYVWRTRSLPELKEFNWYGSGKKVFPSDIDLTPTVLKHWYCGDGHYRNNGGNDYISIALANEWKRTDKVDAYFESVGLPTPRYDIREHEDHTKCDASFTVDASRELFRYMGDPPPGFAHKWGDHVNDSHDPHDDLKQRLRARDYRGPFASVTITDEELRSVPIEAEINVDGTDKVTFHRQELESWLG